MDTRGDRGPEKGLWGREACRSSHLLCDGPLSKALVSTSQRRGTIIIHILYTKKPGSGWSCNLPSVPAGQGSLGPPAHEATRLLRL